MASIAIRVRINSDSSHAHFAARGQNADGYFAPVSNYYFLEHYKIPDFFGRPFQPGTRKGTATCHILLYTRVYSQCWRSKPGYLSPGRVPATDTLPCHL